MLAASFAAADESGWAPRWVATEADETCGGASSAKWPFVDAHSPAGYKCPAGSDASFCHGGFENPNHGITSFANAADARLTIFQRISLEGGRGRHVLAKDAVSPWSWVYFTSMIILGAFFAVNLALAVLFVSFVVGKHNGGGGGHDAEAVEAQRRGGDERLLAGRPDRGRVPGDAAGDTYRQVRARGHVQPRERGGNRWTRPLETASAH